MYSACLRNQTELLYVKYNLIVPSVQELFQTNGTYGLETETDGFIRLNFEKLKTLYDEVGIIQVFIRGGG